MPSSLQVSTNIALTIAGVPSNISASFSSAPMTGEAGSQVLTLAPGTTPVPIGPVADAALDFLFVENLDPAIPLAISTNSNGSAPFATLKGGQHTMVPVTPGQLYYFYVAGGNSLQALVLAVAD